MFNRIEAVSSPAITAVGFLSLPVELLIHELIPLIDLATLSCLLQTCTTTHGLSMNNDVWKSMLNRNFSPNWPSLLSEEDCAELEALHLGTLLQPLPGIYRKIYSWLSVLDASFAVDQSNTSSSYQERTHIVKITVLGSSGVGKTSLIDRAIFYRFRMYTRCGIGADFWTQMYKPVVDDQFEDFPDKPLRSVCAQFWDTAGQERFRTLGTYYYRGTNATLLCFSIADRASFEAVEKDWVPELRQQSSKYCQLVLVGLKCDLPDSGRRVQPAEARALATKLGCKYIECSAKEDINVRALMAHVVTLAVQSLRRSTPPKELKPDDLGLQMDSQQSYLARSWNWIKSKLSWW